VKVRNAALVAEKSTCDPDPIREQELYDVAEIFVLNKPWGLTNEKASKTGVEAQIVNELRFGSLVGETGDFCQQFVVDQERRSTGQRHCCGREHEVEPDLPGIFRPLHPQQRKTVVAPARCATAVADKMQIFVG
jgi:hypothetical protein